ncbi:class I SAM-dependent methyltransferase [Caldibacillus lycopersici]|uniref:Class I SAM-dependent methyltransferase n=1 Tax=Perspicuibacillus lycopersici TaxID=1325689 RepID=A0AAE3IVF8_9BACI|nr:class I SAM-dependent methyltransferase [Perspicuibacillus lycopersici]MCU9612795.1 class I SAM-dependent methyltransferase [Perspicuibacillus lycopersici]
MTEIRTNKIFDYFQQIGLTIETDSNEFWNKIEQIHGKDIKYQLMDSMKKRGTSDDRKFSKTDSIYELKNRTLSLSIDFSSATADFTKGFLEWFIEFPLPVSPKKILEIGCDNGITTCFLALLFPEAAIIGIDQSKNGILCAQQLANLLGLTNITFVAEDFLAYSKHSCICDFDLIISLKTMHEMMTVQAYHTNFSTNAFINKLTLTSDPIVHAIKQLLKNEKSTYISCERFLTVQSYAYWSELLRKSQLFIDWEHATINHSTAWNQAEKMPIFIANGTNHECSTYNGLLQMATKYDDSVIDSFERVTDILAEEFLNNITKKAFLGGTQISWQNSGEKLRLECWKDTTSAYLHKYNNLGNSELRKFPLSEIDEIFYEIEEYIAEIASPYETNTDDYETIVERNSL